MINKDILCYAIMSICVQSNLAFIIRQALDGNYFYDIFYIEFNIQEEIEMSRYVAPSKARRIARQEARRQAEMATTMEVMHNALTDIVIAASSIKSPNGTTRKIERIASNGLPKNENPLYNTKLVERATPDELHGMIMNAGL